MSSYDREPFGSGRPCHSRVCARRRIRCEDDLAPARDSLRVYAPPERAARPRWARRTDLAQDRRVDIDRPLGRCGVRWPLEWILGSDSLPPQPLWPCWRRSSTDAAIAVAISRRRPAGLPTLPGLLTW